MKQSWVVLALCGSAFGQSPVVLGMNNYIHATENLDKTAAFYRDVFGLEKPPPPRPPNPAVPALIGVLGAQLQVQIFRLPGAFGFELTHFGNIELKEGGQPRLTDPGVATLTIRVRDLQPVLTALKKSGKPDQPLVLRDPDGYPVEVVQVSPTSESPPAGNILGASMGLNVSDLERTRKFYHDLLGFELTGDNRQLAGNVPGTKARIEFREFKGVPSTPFHLRVPDPGCPAIALHVADLDGLLNRMKAAGVKTISAGGMPAEFSPTIRNIFVEDPDGFKIELYQASQ